MLLSDWHLRLLLLLRQRLTLLFLLLLLLLVQLLLSCDPLLSACPIHTSPLSARNESHRVEIRIASRLRPVLTTVSVGLGHHDGGPGQRCPNHLPGSALPSSSLAKLVGVSLREETGKRNSSQVGKSVENRANKGRGGASDDDWADKDGGSNTFPRTPAIWHDVCQPA